MSFCMNCGAPLNGTDNFCPACGERVTGKGESQAVAVEAPSVASARDADETPAADAAPGDRSSVSATDSDPRPVSSDAASASGACSASSTSTSAPDANPDPFSAAPEPSQPPQDFNYASQPKHPTAPQDFSYAASTPAAGAAPEDVEHVSPLKRAWVDFKASPHKFKIIAKLAALSLVPGAGAVAVNGYIYSWGKDAAFDRKGPMPVKLIRPGVLGSGFSVTLLSLVWTLIWCCAVILLAAIGLDDALGWIFLLLPVVLGPFVAISLMCSAITGRVRSGLAFKNVWGMFTAKGKTGKAYSSYLIPMAIFAVIAVILIMVFAVIMFASVYGIVGTSMGYFSYYDSYHYGYYSDLYAIALVLMALVAMIPAFLVAVFVAFLLSIAASLVLARAFGYWLRDFEPAAWDEYRARADEYARAAV